MRIAIYDTQHYEMINVLFHVFNINENHILFLVDSKIHQKLSNAPLTKDKILKHEFLLDNVSNSDEFYSACNLKLNQFKPDLIIFNTIDKDYAKIWNLIRNLKCHVAVTIHNINTWLNPPFTLNRIALSNYWYRKKIVKRTDFLIVQEELFISYIRKNKLYTKPVIAIPHTIPEESPAHPVNDKLRIAVPGGIDGVRRDYDFALDVIEEIAQKVNNIQFVFLGQIIGKLGEDIWKRATRLKNAGIDIQHYYDPNSNLLFDSEFQKCDLVFLPLNVDTKYEGISEIYGTTKVTGVIYDMMRFAKPGFVPQKMVIPTEMKDSLFPYSSKSELIQYLVDWANNPDTVEKGKRIAESNADYYSSGNVSMRFWQFYTNNFSR